MRSRKIINSCNYSGPFWLLTIMGKGLPSFDKEGMPGSDSRPRQGWLESARDSQSAAFLDHPVLIRGGEFKSPGSQGPE